MNKVILIGRLTRDPDIRTTNSGDNPTTIARYSLAVERRFRRDGDGTDFINIVAFGKSAEFAEKYLHKGMKIAVEGRIQTGSYTNRDGQKVYTTDVVVENHEFVESKGDGNAPANAVATQPAPAATAAPAVADGFASAGDDDELPWG